MTAALIAAARAVADAAHENAAAWTGEASVPWQLIYALRDALREEAAVGQQ